MNLKRDMPGEIRRIAAYLDIPIAETRWEAILEYCSFEWMKANAARTGPSDGAEFTGGTRDFFHSGTNRRWAETLTSEDVAEYEARAEHELGRECARWLATGKYQ